MRKWLSKYNKEKCAKCCYKVKLTLNDGNGYNIACDYSSKSGTTCLYKEGREVKDRRGGDFNNCLLFKEKKGGKA